MDKKTLILLLASVPALLCACGRKDEVVPATRSEYIKVYETSENKTVDAIQVPFDGVTDGKIHVLTNVNLQMRYFVDQTDPDNDWLVIKSVEEVAPGHSVITYDAASLLPLNDLSRRAGHLSLSSPENSFGKFMSVQQGYKRQFIEEFKDLSEGNVVITGKQTYTTREFPEVNKDFFDYISFNVWAVVDNDFLSKNITLDVTVFGGMFYDTGLTTYRINVPVGTGASKDNLKYLLLVGDGKRMSEKTHFVFSTANDDGVFVHIDNFAGYQVTQADLGIILDDEYFDEMDDGGDWI